MARGLTDNMAITVTRGPSLRVPFAAVICDFDLSARTDAGADEITSRLSRWLPEDCLARLRVPDDNGDLTQWVMRLAQAVTEVRGDMVWPAACGATEGGCWVALGYHDAPATQHALRFALVALQGMHTTVDDAVMRSRATAALNPQLQRQPKYSTRALMRMADARDLPVYPVSAELQIWQYGQGHKAWHFHSASTQADSSTGVMLQQNKAQSNEWVRRLGLPGVEHGIAAQPRQALALAAQLGYPLVVKPLDSGQGYGVSVNLDSAEQITAAYTKAVKYSRTRRVIVERYVAGDDFRLVVFGGRLQWVIKRMAPEVAGDGASSIAELIERKNAGISHDLIKKGFAKPVAVDDELRRTLALSQLRLEDRLPAGAVARLRSNANVSTGGSFTDVSDTIHPDNRAMAETVARAFRLDSVGIDFITPDIARSWRDVKCAVIEVNTTPGLLSDEQAELLLECKFPGRGNGRVPSALVLCGASASRDQLFSAHAQNPTGMGMATLTGARLNGLLRPIRQRTDAGAAAEALLFDPACESLVVVCTLNEIRRHGLPLDRFDICVWTEGAEPDPALRELLSASCSQVTKISVKMVMDMLCNLLGQ